MKKIYVWEKNKIYVKRNVYPFIYAKSNNKAQKTYKKVKLTFARERKKEERRRSLSEQ